MLLKANARYPAQNTLGPPCMVSIHALDLPSPFFICYPIGRPGDHVTQTASFNILYPGATTETLVCNWECLHEFHLVSVTFDINFHVNQSFFYTFKTCYVILNLITYFKCLYNAEKNITLYVYITI